MAALVAWLVSMLTRQSGHFFFEPKGRRRAQPRPRTNTRRIKVGYNLQRKLVLMAIWAASPLLLLWQPELLGLLEPHADWRGFAHNVGLMWFAVGVVGGLLFRMLQLFALQGVGTGLVWAKDPDRPFHDIMLYHKAPLHRCAASCSTPVTRQAEMLRGPASPASGAGPAAGLPASPSAAQRRVGPAAVVQRDDGPDAQPGAIELVRSRRPQAH